MKPRKVFDSGNKRRLLGELTSHPEKFIGRSLEVHIAPPVMGFFPDPEDLNEPLRIERVTFTIEHLHLNGGWDTEGILLTSAPLSDLLRLPTFRLPGESDVQAERRREEAYWAETERRRRARVRKSGPGTDL